MVQTGVLTENDPVELIDGWIVPKMPHNPPHDSAVELCEERLRPLIPAGWRVRIQSAITTPDSEPEPDLVVVAGTARSHSSRHPEPREIALVIEVADSSLSFDRGGKSAAYARSGIVCYWIINLVNRQLEVYTDPSGPAPSPSYRQRTDYGANTSVPLVIGGQQVALIPVSDLLP
jgi:hypothetical protein